MEVVNSIRKTRSDLNIHPKVMLNIHCISEKKNILDYIEKNKDILVSLTKVDSIKYELATDKIKNCIAITIKNLIVYIPIQGNVNVEDEIKRLNKKNLELKDNLIKVENKLNNKDFIEKAPSKIIQENTEKQKTYKKEIKEIKDLLEKLSN